jgi:hypothetical protein
MLLHLIWDKTEDVLNAAAKLEKRYAKELPGAAADVAFRAGQLHVWDAVAGDATAWERVRDHFQRFVKKYRWVAPVDAKVRAWALVGDAQQHLGDGQAAQRAYTKAVRIVGGKDFEQSLRKSADDCDLLELDRPGCPTFEERERAACAAAARARHALTRPRFEDLRPSRLPELERCEQVLAEPSSPPVPDGIQVPTEEPVHGWAVPGPILEFEPRVEDDQPQATPLPVFYEFVVPYDERDWLPFVTTPESEDSE